VTPASDSDEPPLLILCDWAEAINGKLYIQGAGFNLIRANAPFATALAILWQVPWHLTNVRHKIVLKLVSADGEPFTDAGTPIEVSGEVETGRPPGTKPGDSFPTPLAIKLPPIPVPPGDYRWELHINDQPRAKASFRAVENLPGG